MKILYHQYQRFSMARLFILNMVILTILGSVRINSVSADIGNYLI